MHTAKRILSIDFDYFQQVTMENLSAYPNSTDNDTSLSEYAWGSIYGALSAASDLIRQVKIRKDEFDAMKAIIRNQKAGVPVMITNSHRDIYDFIHCHVDEKETLYLVNIDMHHGMIDDRQVFDTHILNCGNWISFICREYKTDLTWIANPVSSEMYSLDKFETLKKPDCIIPSSVNVIRDIQFDAIFLCRSDTWTVPHLDKYFSSLGNSAVKHFKNVYIERNILKPRKEYLEIAKECARLTQQAMPNNKTYKRSRKPISQYKT